MLVLHFKSQAIIAPQTNLTELKARLYMALAYVEELGEVTYEHYDVTGVRK